MICALSCGNAVEKSGADRHRAELPHSKREVARASPHCARGLNCWNIACPKNSPRAARHSTAIVQPVVPDPPVPFQLIEAMYSAFVSQSITSPSGIRGLVAKSWNGTSKEQNRTPEKVLPLREKRKQFCERARRRGRRLPTRA
jgi:hypothetical protein